MCPAASDIEKVTTYSSVLGLTSVDDELFVLLNQVENEVAVYSINDYQLLRHLNLPDFKPDGVNDMTSCAQHKCLYASDMSNSCIHRYDLASSASSQWQVTGKPWGLSVTPSCNLLVTCRGELDKLVELGADDGQCVREIALRSEVAYPRHSVQLTTGKFVVCSGDWGGDLQQVCVVGTDGKVTHIYGGYHSVIEDDKLNRPSHLAVDKDSQFVFVADAFNDRVVLLSPTLERVRYVSEDVTQPTRLCFHQATRRLFVGQRGGSFSVIQCE